MTQVAELTEPGRRDRIHENEAGSEQADLRPIEVQLRLPQAHGEPRDDESIDVVEEVDERQDQQDVARRAARDRARRVAGRTHQPTRRPAGARPPCLRQYCRSAHQ